MTIAETAIVTRRFKGHLAANKKMTTPINAQIE
jgi:hypothetical protein